MFNPENDKTHPSFGVINIHRSTGAAHPLFGSSIIHTATVTLEIHRARLTHDLSQDWIQGYGRPLISVDMSPSQFAEAITSLNMGGGVPCTITFVEGLGVEQTPYESKRVVADADFEAKIKMIAEDNSKYINEIRMLLDKPNIPKNVREGVLKTLGLLQQEIRSNIPYMKREWTEQMDKTVTEAKANFDAHVDHHLRVLGIEGAKTKFLVEYQATDVEKPEKKEGEGG